MRILAGRDEDVCTLVASIIWGPGVRFQDRKARGFGYLDGDGILRAGFVLYDFDPANLTMQVAAASTHRNMQTLRHLRVIPETAFAIEPRLRVLIARTAESNAVVRRVMGAFGAVETAIPGLRLRGDGTPEAEIVCTLDRATFEELVAKRASL